MSRDDAERKMLVWKRRIEKAPKPSNDAELELLSLWYFGKALHAKFSIGATSGSYEIVERYNSYHGKGYEFSQGCSRGYDHSAFFWEHVFGTLSCGGIADRSYGQFNITGHRNKARLMRWQDTKRKRGISVLRSAFLRLARCVGAGENRAIRGGSVLMTGRVDGAVGAS